MDVLAAFDSPTAAVIFSLGGLSLAIFLLVLHLLNPGLKGLGRWAFGDLAVSVGAFLIILFAGAPFCLTMIIANTLLVLGPALLADGVRAFLGQPSKTGPVFYLLPLFCALSMAYFSLAFPSLLIRVAIISGLLAAQFGYLAALLLYRYPYGRKGAARFTALVFSLLALLFAVRLVLVFDPDQTWSFVRSAFHPVLVLAMMGGGTAWTFGLLLMSMTLAAEKTLQAEIDLSRRKQDVLVRTIIDSIPYSIAIKDRDSRFLTCNAAFAEAVGKPLERIVGSTDFDHVPEQLAVKYRQADEQVMADGRASTIYEEFVINGRTVWIDTVKVPVRDEGGAVTGVLVMFRDVTERLKSQRDLEESEQRYRELNQDLERRVDARTRELREAKRDIDLFFEVSVDYLCILDTGGHFLKMSPSWTKELGWREDEVVGSQFLSFVHLEDRERVLESVNFIQAGISLRDFHLRFRKADGAYIWLSVAAVGIRERGIIIAAAHDITIQLEIEERLRSARVEAERANKVKSQFIATMSHELRTPLNAVLGYSALLDQIVSDERGRGYLKSIGTSGRALLAIINDILDLTRAESGRIELVPAPFEFHRLMDELAEIFRFSVEEKNLALELRVSALVPKMLMLDQARLRQVLVNLVGNAIKFTAQGSVSVLVDAAEETADRQTADVRVSRRVTLKIDVVDTGIGITEEYRNRLFDPFSQQDAEISRTYGGTGLGLAIAKRLLDLMGGSIRCEAPEEGGTRFRIVIPRVVAAGIAGQAARVIGHAAEAPGAPASPGKAPEGTGHDAGAGASVNAGAGGVLVIGGDELGRTAVREALAAAGLGVREAAAIPVAEGQLDQVDLVVIDDDQAPGLEFCRELRALPGREKVPVVILSDRSDGDSLAAGFQAGATEYIVKPVDGVELGWRIVKILEQKRERDALAAVNGELAKVSAATEEKNARLENLVAKLEHSATTDELTSLANRRSIRGQLHKLVARSGRSGASVAIIMGDLDRFKLVNDHYGHAAGDLVLAECAKLIAASLREGDAVGRWGGEEFLILLPDTDLEPALKAAERINALIAEKAVSYGTDLIRTGVSLGVSALRPVLEDQVEATAGALVRAAEDALYRAKTRGRNRAEALAAVNPSARPRPPSAGSSR